MDSEPAANEDFTNLSANASRSASSERLVAPTAPAVVNHHIHALGGIGGAGGEGRGHGIGGSGGSGQGPSFTYHTIAEHFTVNTSQKQEQESDFRRISLGDIDLQQEIGVAGEPGIAREFGAVTGRSGSRRLYSARIEGRKSKDIARYMSFRHPNILQIFGVASAGDIHATLFHDGRPSSRPRSTF
ncbi:hypothetical protein B0H14DRAFT_532102 [Mycena olivaceomarginata]|nr:hypothetical protein B0H14DRAFT_532102 [Mycena olivaceomarginata]